ncbi:hypothetical protein J6590_081958 [Homalodisca vitripennis]|nr:hypothetical protein J6590_081958 [Homalodisca vitripennis]
MDPWDLDSTSACRYKEPTKKTFATNSLNRIYVEDIKTTIIALFGFFPTAILRNLDEKVFLLLLQVHNWCDCVKSVTVRS